MTKKTTRPPSLPKKHKSGAQKRREKAERETAARAQVMGEAKRLGIPIGYPPPPPADDQPPGDFAAEFTQAGEPNLEDPGTDLAYVRKLQLIALRQMATTRDPPPEQQALWKRIREMSAVVGMTSNRAALESEVRRLKQALAEQKAKFGTAHMVEGGDVPLPPTARNSGRSRGPRPLPPDHAGPPPSEGP